LSLGHLGAHSKSAEDALRVAAEDSDEATALYALTALAGIGKSDPSAIPKLLEAMNSTDTQLSSYAIAGLLKMANANPDKFAREINQQLNTLKNGRNLDNLVKLTGMLRQKPSELKNFVFERYDVVSTTSKAGILHILSYSPEESELSTDIIKKAINDPDANIRRLGINLSHRLGEQDFRRLVPHFLKDSEPANRMTGLMVLRNSRHKVPEAASLVMKMSADPILDVRVAAVSVLDNVLNSQTELLTLYEKLLNDPEPQVRLAVLKRLASFGTSEPISKLLDRAKPHESNPYVLSHLNATLNGAKGLSSASEIAEFYLQDLKRMPGEDLTR
jgi:HEAT repeat protein